MFWRLSHPRQCAMDELAVSLKIDPLELRLRWYSDRNQNTNQPFSSKALGHLRRRRRTTAIRFATLKRGALSQITPVVGRSDAA
jgi:xanthine dehydrogenase YagR molybdenum-binding subunit